MALCTMATPIKSGLSIQQTIKSLWSTTERSHNALNENQIILIMFWGPGFLDFNIDWCVQLISWNERGQYGVMVEWSAWGEN